VGLDKSLRILNRITSGAGRMQHMETLEELSRFIRECSLCGLGQSAPNPVLTTMRHFRHEFEDHIVARRCQAGVCTDLALSPCENSCPLHMNIPRFLQLFKEERIEEAFDSIIFDNLHASRRRSEKVSRLLRQALAPLGISRPSGPSDAPASVAGYGL